MVPERCPCEKLQNDVLHMRICMFLEPSMLCKTILMGKHSRQHRILGRTYHGSFTYGFSCDFFIVDPLSYRYCYFCNVSYSVIIGPFSQCQ